MSKIFFVIIILCMGCSHSLSQEHEKIEYYFSEEVHQHLENFMKAYKTKRPDSRFCLLLDKADGRTHADELKLGVYNKNNSNMANILLNTTQRNVILRGESIPILSQDDITFGFVDGEKLDPDLAYPHTLILNAMSEVLEIRNGLSKNEDR